MKPCCTARRIRWRLASLVCALLLGVAAPVVPPAAAQDASPRRALQAARFAPGALAALPALDRRGLLAVYRRDGPAFTSVMRATDGVAYPLFYGAVPAAWGAALLRGEGYGDAYRLTLSEGLALGAVLGLKKVFGRPRPFRAMAGVQSRSERYGEGREGRFAGSFPSGHAAVSFALAGSWSLSHPEWYVIGPAFGGATVIAVSRLWLGVHYPSDVLGGALLGAGAAVAVHLLRDALTPSALQFGADPTWPSMVRLRFRLP